MYNYDDAQNYLELIFQHTERTFYGPDQSVRRLDSDGYLILAEDRHMTRYLEGRFENCNFIRELAQPLHLNSDY